MPQMAPLNWLSLMITFSIIFIMMSTINFSTSTYNPIHSLMTKGESSKNWKW